MSDDDKASPRPWAYENVEVDADRTAYGVVKDANGKSLFDTMNSDVAVIHTDTDTDSPNTYRWDEQGEQNLTLVCRAVNAHAALVAALRPLAALPVYHDLPADCVIYRDPSGHALTVGDVRAAQAALAEARP